MGFNLGFKGLIMYLVPSDTRYVVCNTDSHAPSLSGVSKNQLNYLETLSIDNQKNIPVYSRV